MQLSSKGQTVRILVGKIVTRGAIYKTLPKDGFSGSCGVRAFDLQAAVKNMNGAENS